MNRTLKIFLIVAIIGLVGCAGIVNQSVQDQQEVAQSFDQLMTQFVENWPYISGAIDGAYAGRLFDVPSGLIDLKGQIDKIVKGDVGKYEKGKIATLWSSIVTAEIVRWIQQFNPKILQLIPAAMLAF